MSATGTSSATVSESPTNTPPLSPTASSSATQTPSGIQTPSQTPSIGVSASATAGLSSGGLPRIVKLLPNRQPFPWQGGKLFVQLEGSANSMEIRVYSSAMTLVGVIRHGGQWGPGDHLLDLNVNDWASGLYYVHVTAEREGQRSSAAQVLFLLK